MLKADVPIRIQSMPIPGLAVRTSSPSHTGYIREGQHAPFAKAELSATSDFLPQVLGKLHELVYPQGAYPSVNSGRATVQKKKSQEGKTVN